MSRVRITTANFIDRANVVHKFKYDYSQVIYSTTHTKVNIICTDHGQFLQTPVAHLRGQGCPKCALITKKNTFINNYGVDHPLKCKKIQDKIKSTVLKKYGVEYLTQSSIIQNKIKQTNIERYGGHPKTSLEVQEKFKQTCLERYGVNNPSKYYDVKEKKKLLSDIKYGVNFHQQLHMIDVLPLLEDYSWLFDQYITQNKTATQIASELNIGGTAVLRYLRNHEINIQYSYGYSYMSICWINRIMEQEGIDIQHALNGGEYQIPGTRYKADGFCKETNTIYEFHGDLFHGNPDLFKSDELCHPFNQEITAGELYQKTIDREHEIKNLGYNLVVMWENNFKKE